MIFDTAMSLHHASRIARAAMVYTGFGVGVFTTTNIIVPLARLLRLGPPQDDLLTQLWLHRAARMVRWLVVRLGVIDLTLQGVERLTEPGPLLIVANHPSNLDATLLTAAMPQVDNVAEVSWTKAPIIGKAIAKAGHLRNDNPRQVIEEGARRLRSGRRLLIFPEGSRSPAGALHPFHRGAARIALASGCEVLPVVIRCQPPIGLKGKRWYDIPKETPRMTIAVGHSIPVDRYLDGGEAPGIAARKITRGLRDYFLRELRYADSGHD